MLTVFTMPIDIELADDTTDDIFGIAPDSVRAAMREAVRRVEE